MSAFARRFANALEVQSAVDVSQAAQDAAIANAADPLKGAGRSGYAATLGYAAGTVGRKLRERVSVKDFGAVGNGTTDDTAAIQAAIDYLNPYVYAASFNYAQGGGTLFFPVGTYRITNTLRVPSFVRLVGVGPQSFTSSSGIGAPGDSSVIYCDIATAGKVAIDTAGYDTATGLRYTALATRSNADFDGHAMLWTHGVAFQDLGIYTDRNTDIGLRIMGSPSSSIRNVSILGFNTGLVVTNSYVCEYTGLWIIANKVGAYLYGNNAVQLAGEFDLSTKTLAAGNVPSFWDAGDTNYGTTSLYLVGNNSVSLANITTQHGNRGIYANACSLNIGSWYAEDLTVAKGLLEARSTRATIGHLFMSANGVTVLDNASSSYVSLLALSGTYGKLVGTADAASQLVLGPGIVRNYAFPDFAADPHLVQLVPSSPAVVIYVDATNGGNGRDGSISGPVQNIKGIEPLLVPGRKHIVYLQRATDYATFDTILVDDVDIEFAAYGAGVRVPTIIVAQAAGALIQGIRFKESRVRFTGINFSFNSNVAADPNQRRAIALAGSCSVIFDTCGIAILGGVALFQPDVGQSFDATITYINCAVTGAGALGATSTAGNGTIRDTAHLSGTNASSIAAAVKTNGYGGLYVVKSFLLA